MVPRDARTYVSIDIDVLDLPLIPGCVSAEPNGMSYAELRDTLAAIAEHCEVVGLASWSLRDGFDVAAAACLAWTPRFPGSKRRAHETPRSAALGRRASLCSQRTN